MRKNKVLAVGLSVCLLVCCSGNVAAAGKEEIADSTFNPIYMGSDTDYKGDKLEITTDENGAVLNKVLKDHQAQFTDRKLIEVSDRVYVSVNYGMANTTLFCKSLYAEGGGLSRSQSVDGRCRQHY